MSKTVSLPCGFPLSRLNLRGYLANHEIFRLAGPAIGAGFICQLAPTFSLNQQQALRALVHQISGLAGEWPAGTILQWTLFATHRPDQMRQEPKENVSDVVRQAVAAQNEHFEKISTKSAHGWSNIYEFRLAVSFSIPSSDRPTFGEIEALCRFQGLLRETLYLQGMSPTPLTLAEHAQLVAKVMDIAPGLHLDDGTEMPTAGAFTDGPAGAPLRLRRGAISAIHFDRNFRDANTVPMFASQWTTYHGGNLPRQFLVTASILYGDRINDRWALERAHERTSGRLYRAISQFSRSAASHAQDVKRVYDHCADTGDRPVSFKLSFLAISQSDQEADADAMVLQQLAGSYGVGCNYVADDHDTLLSALPFGCVNPTPKARKSYTVAAPSQLVHLLPVFGEWGGNSAGSGTPLLSRSGQPMSFDLFKSDTNYNAVVSGETGSGKSTLVKDQVLATLAAGGRAWVIDEGDWADFCRNLDGRVLKFGKGCFPNLTPFRHIDDFANEGDSATYLIAGLVDIALGQRVQSADVMRYYLRNIIAAAWREHGKALTMDILHAKAVAYIENEGVDHDVAGKLADALYMWSTNGAGGQLFDAVEPIDLSGEFVVFDLGDLHCSRNMCSAAVLSMIWFVSRQMMQSNRAERKLAVVDGLVDLFVNSGGEAGAEVIEAAWRMARKYRGAWIATIQRGGGIEHSPVGRAIGGNSAHLMFLHQHSCHLGQDDHMASRLSQQALTALKTVAGVRGHYIEAMISSNHNGGIGRLYLPTFKQILYSSNRATVAELAQFREQGLSTPDAIHRLIASRSETLAAAE